jgi:hypothetical protein
MEKLTPKRTTLFLGMEHNIKLNNVSEITKETKSELIRRLIDNEFFRLTDKPELILHGNPAVAEKQLEYVIKQLNLLKKETETTRAAIYSCDSDVLRSQYIITRTLFSQFGMTADKIVALGKESQKLAIGRLKIMLKTVEGGVRDVLKVILEPPPKDEEPKEKELRDKIEKENDAKIKKGIEAEIENGIIANFPPEEKIKFENLCKNIATRGTTADDIIIRALRAYINKLQMPPSGETGANPGDPSRPAPETGEAGAGQD